MRDARSATDTRGLRSDTAYTLGAGLALVVACVIVWMNLAAGLIGIEDDDPANLLYAGVLAIGVIGAVTARFKPRGLALAMYAAALAQAAVGVLALTLPNTASPEMIIVVHLLFVAFFASSGSLFRYASQHQIPADRAGKPSPDGPTHA